MEAIVVVKLGLAKVRPETVADAKICHGVAGGPSAPPQRALTTAQGLVLDFIIASIEEHGYPPTLREMMAAFGWRSTNAASDHLQALQRKGRIRISDKARGIQIVGVRWRMVPAQEAADR